MKRIGFKRSVGLAALVLMVIVLLTACGGSSSGNEIPAAAESSGEGTGSAGTSASTAQGPDAQAYADCMRDHGVAMSDPDPETGLPQFDDSVDTSSAAVQSALDACQSLMPAGIRGEGGEQDMDAYLAFAECMRENGFPDFPDPQPGSDEGLFAGADVDRNSSAFQQATSVCGDVLE